MTASAPLTLPTYCRQSTPLSLYTTPIESVYKLDGVQFSYIYVQSSIEYRTNIYETNQPLFNKISCSQAGYQGYMNVSVLDIAFDHVKKRLRANADF